MPVSSLVMFLIVWKAAFGIVGNCVLPSCYDLLDIDRFGRFVCHNIRMLVLADARSTPCLRGTIYAASWPPAFCLVSVLQLKLALLPSNLDVHLHQHLGLVSQKLLDGIWKCMLGVAVQAHLRFWFFSKSVVFVICSWFTVHWLCTNA